MKKIYITLTILLTLTIWSCKTKKTVTDLKQTETEQTETSITENNNQTSFVTEKEEKREAKSEVDKSFLESWMQIKSDVAVLEDSHGNRWTFTNPELTKKQTQSNNITKSEQSTTEVVQTTETKENTQTDVSIVFETKKQSDFKESTKTKSKEPFWLYASVGFVVLVFGYLVLKRFRSI